MQKLYSIKLLSFIIISMPLICIAHEHHYRHFSPNKSRNVGYTIKSSEGVDITNKILTDRSPDCSNYVGSYFATAKDYNLDKANTSYMTIRTDNNNCTIISNGIPNHIYDDAKYSFPNNVTPQYQRYTIPKSPKIADKITPLSLRMDNAIMLNGVKVDLLAAGCFDIANGKVGCFNPNQKWRYNPVYEKSGFIMDSHHAHSQSNGAYHYHASPNALFDNDATKESPVIGFAADGFPIYGSYIIRDGKLVTIKSSYQLKKGNRPETKDSPGGKYTGEFIDDYQYVRGSGDLDECNGMIYNGHYGYYVTKGYPYIINCFKGIPNKSFIKRTLKKRF